MPSNDIEINSICSEMAILAMFDDYIGDEQAFEPCREQLWSSSADWLRAYAGIEKSLPSISIAAVAQVREQVHAIAQTADLQTKPRRE